MAAARGLPIMATVTPPPAAAGALARARRRPLRQLAAAGGPGFQGPYGLRQPPRAALTEAAADSRAGGPAACQPAVLDPIRLGAAPTEARA